MPISVVLVDDHPLLLEGLRSILAAEPDFHVLATCGKGEEVLPAVLQHQPDILVLDLRMPGKDGLAVLQELKEKALPTQVVLFTAALNEDDLMAAIQFGVQGVVLKEMSPRLLIRCLRQVHAGKPWLEKRSASQALNKILRQESEMQVLSRILTPREIDLARLVATGLDNRTIAEQAHISEGTVKTHLHRIYSKLELKNRLALTSFAREKGLV